MNDEIVEANRRAWNYVMPLHRNANSKVILEKLISRKEILIDDNSMRILKGIINIKGKRVIHICCNNGLEIISFKRLGAERCVGIDISEEAILEAKDWGSKAELNVDFYRTNVYDLPKKLFNSFDLVYTSVGTLRWLPDLNQFFSIVNSLLVPGGKMFISDIHPLAEIINDDRDLSISPLEIVRSYNDKSAMSDNKSLDYIGKTGGIGMKKFWFSYSFHDIIGLPLDKGFKLIYFEESLEDTSTVCPLLVKQKIKIPLSFSLVAEKSK